MTEDKLRQNVQLLLFTDLGVETEKAKRILEDMKLKPHKIASYHQLLMDDLVKQHETFRAMPPNELVAKVKDRITEWESTIGPVGIQELVSMSKQWNIAIDSIFNKKITPEIIKEMLDVFVIGQEMYKIKLSVAFHIYLMHTHQSGLWLPKSNLLVCGPSGSGKTYGMQVLSELFHVPFVLVHCNSLVQEGIIGPSLTDGFTSLLQQGWLPEEIEHSVVCFDEFDKLFEKNGTGGDSGYYNGRVVNELLNIVDDKGEVDFKSNFDKSDGSRTKLPTRKMMFVFTGVFNGLTQQQGKKEEEKAEEPVVRRKIGFLSSLEPEPAPSIEQKPKKQEDMTLTNDEPTIEDFINFGIKPEILGRVQNFVFLDELTEDDMIKLFDLGMHSPLREFEQYFIHNGINTILTEEGKHTLVKLALQRKLGVRGLKNLLQQVLLEDMYDLEVGADNTLRITKQYIYDNLNN